MCVSCRARADPVSSLKISGRLIHWWYALKAEIKERSTEDDCGYEKRVNLLKSVGKQVKTGLGNLVAAVEGGEFKSKGIAQAWEVIKKFDYSFALIGKEDGNLQCLSEYMNETHGKMGAGKCLFISLLASDSLYLIMYVVQSENSTCMPVLLMLFSMDSMSSISLSA